MPHLSPLSWLIMSLFILVICLTVMASLHSPKSGAAGLETNQNCREAVWKW